MEPIGIDRTFFTNSNYSMAFHNLSVDKIFGKQTFLNAGLVLCSSVTGLDWMNYACCKGVNDL